MHQKRFDIHGFDAGKLDFALIKQAIEGFQDTQTSVFEGWTITHVHDGADSIVYRLDPADADALPSLSVKIYNDKNVATRAYTALEALHEFGFSIGPRPFFHEEQWIVTEWIHGEPLKAPPAPNDDGQWHRIMALLGVPWNMPFAKYSSQVALHGTGAQSPGDVIAMLDNELGKLNANHPDFAAVANLVENVRSQVSPQWNSPSLITLNHMDPRLHHFVWDGAHMRLISWQQVDWADKAYAVGVLCAHPAYLNMEPDHWVWYRWELSRLNRDQTLRARATTYTSMLLVYHAVRCTVAISSPFTDASAQQLLHEQRALYMERARRAFG